MGEAERFRSRKGMRFTKVCMRMTLHEGEKLEERRGICPSVFRGFPGRGMRANEKTRSREGLWLVVVLCEILQVLSVPESSFGAQEASLFHGPLVRRR